MDLNFILFSSCSYEAMISERFSAFEYEEKKKKIRLPTLVKTYSKLIYKLKKIDIDFLIHVIFFSLLRSICEKLIIDNARLYVFWRRGS